MSGGNVGGQSSSGRIECFVYMERVMMRVVQVTMSCLGFHDSSFLIYKPRILFIEMMRMRFSV